MSKSPQTIEALSNLELIRLIENYRDYDTELVLAAKDEVRKRHISGEEISAIKAKLREELRNRKADSEISIPKTEVQAELSEKASGHYVTASTEPRDQKSSAFIGGMLLAISAFTLIMLYLNFEFIGYMFSGEIMEWDFSLIISALFMIALPLGTILLWTQAKAGWLILSLLFSHYLANNTARLLLYFNKEEYEGTALFEYIQSTEIGMLLIYFIVELALLIGINRKAFHNAYGANKVEAGLAIGLSLILSWFWMYNNLQALL